MTNNNFNVLRLIAAFAVLISHSFILSDGMKINEPIYRLSQQQVTLGRIAVAVFFIVSGYLITGSYLRSRNPIQFLWARALRLLPALAATLIILAIIVAPLLTTLPINVYFSSPELSKFIVINLSLTGFVSGLPGVFEDNPFPVAVDGSLWTLGYEAECYGMILVLGMTGLLNRWVMLALFGAVLLASGMSLGGIRIEFASYFIGGAVMHLWQPPLRRWIALSCSFFLCIAFLAGNFQLLCATAGAYLVCYAAFGLRPLRVFERIRSDLSYGVYIWAFPIQQMVTMALGAAAVWWANILISVPVVLGLAWLSWNLVESPALALKHKMPLWRHRFS